MARLIDTNLPLSGSIDNVTLRRQKDGTIVATHKVTYRKPTRTKATMRAQLPMGNLNAMSHVLADEWADLMEGCVTKRKARGRFIGLNMKRGVVYFTKQQQKEGYCLLCSHQLSQGSLKSIGQQFLPDNCITTDIRLTHDITPQTTLGEFAADLLAYNSEFKGGDSLLLYTFRQNVNFEGVPGVDMQKVSIRLDRGSSTLLSTLTGSATWCRREGFLSLAAPLSDSGACFVHQRVDGRGLLQVSSQILLCVNPLADEYSTNEAFEAAVESRGGYTRIPMEGMNPEAKETAEEAVQGRRAFFVTVFSSDTQAGLVTTGRGSYKKGTLATLTAVPLPGHRFLHWTDQNDAVVSTQPVCQIPINSDASFKAYFE